MNFEEILRREALSKSHRVYAQLSLAVEEDQVKALNHALKEMMRKELLNSRQHRVLNSGSESL